MLNDEKTKKKFKTEKYKQIQEKIKECRITNGLANEKFKVKYFISDTTQNCFNSSH